jgi:hypothetical protein
MPSGHPPQLFPGRTLRIAHWSTDPRLVDADAMVLEKHLKRLGEVTVERVKTLEDALAAPRDLIIVAAQRVDAGAFAGWLDGLRKRLTAQGGIWVPALILADVPFDVLSEILPAAVADNWYFDILAPAHAASLPIRVANLLRIHDHLHELKRYAAAVDDITTKVTMLESQMRDLRGQEGKPGAATP